MRLINLDRKVLLARRVRWAANFWDRLKGLLGERELPAGEALVLEKCRAVHTFFMRFNIDVLFLDEGDTVLEMQTNVPPGRLAGPVRRAHRVVELPAGVLLRTGTLPGDQLSFLENRKTLKSVGDWE